MKILIVASKYYPAVGGLEVAVQNISSELKKEGHEIRILTNRYSRKLPCEEKIDGITVRRYYFTDRMPRSRSLWIWFKYLIRLLIAPWSLLQLTLEIKKFSPDIVHLHFVGSPALYLLAVQSRTHFKYVASIHGSDVELFPFKSDYQKWLLIKTFQKADYITANSKHLLLEAVEMTREDISSKSGVVPMAFPYEDYDRFVEPYKHSKPYLFAAGRFILKKGFDTLIEAFGILVQKGLYHGDLILAGNGEELPKYRELVHKWKLEDRVVFYGFANRQQMAGLMKGCELFVMPSRLEAFGIVLLEALYAGKRVVATRVGGLAELMQENPDYLVAPDFPEKLAEKIYEAVEGKNWHPLDAAKIRTEYSWPRVSQEYCEIYNRISSKCTA